MSMLTFEFSESHPTGAGHFPGNPIIPGALLLAEVLRCIERAEGAHYGACNVKNAKFLAPARPGDRVEITYEASQQGRISFECMVAGNKVLTGVVSASA